MPSTDWKEAIPEGEEERFARYATRLCELQKKNASDGKTARALHARAIAGVEAELEVLADLPEHARYGVFAKPHTYKAFVRYSNGAPRRQHDKVGDVRGLAIKVRGVEGKKVIPGMEDALTQDFLLIQTSSGPFRNADEFMTVVFAAATPALALFKLVGQLGPIRTFQILKRFRASMGPPIATLAGIPFYSTVPIRIGPYSGRYMLEPQQAKGAAAPADRGPTYLADDLAERLRKNPIVYEMKLQFFEDEAKTPIEDPSIDWDTPYVTVARLTIPQQDVTSPMGRDIAKRVEGLSFDTWHALEEHRPLGGMQRARKHGYYASIQERGVSPEPTD
jgi:hypothetical protein